MNKLLEAVKQYVIDDAADYGIMIDGEWGSGKTYFWENSIKPTLIVPDTNLIPCYVSLFGVDDQSIYKRIIANASQAYVLGKFPDKNILGKYLQKLFSFQKRVNSNIFTAIAKTLSKEIPVIKNLSIGFNSLDALKYFGKRFVFCIDDVERSNVSPKVFLGVINHLADQLRFRAIILCNEKWYSSIQDYPDTKEKSIHYTYIFQYDEIDTVIKKIINEDRNQDAKKFLFDEFPVISHILHQNNITNLRIIKRIIHRFIHGIFPCSSEIQKAVDTADHYRQRLSDMLVFLMASIIEMDYKKENKDTFSSLKNYTPLSFLGKDAEWCAKYIDRYCNFYKYENDNRQLWFQAIFDYVTLGCLNKDLLISEIQKFPPKKNLDDLRQAIDYINKGYFEHEDDDFLRAMEKVKNALSTGKIKEISDFLHLLRSFKACIKWEILDMDMDDMYRLFDAAAFHICANVTERYDRDDSPWLRDGFEDKDNSYLDQFDKAATENMFIRNEAFFSDRISSLGKGEEFIPEGRNDVFFKKLGLTEKHSKQLDGIMRSATTTNSILNKIHFFIKERYCTSRIDEIQKETHFLQDLKNRIEEYEKILPKSIKLFNIKQINKMIDKAIKTISAEHPAKMKSAGDGE